MVELDLLEASKDYTLKVTGSRLRKVGEQVVFQSDLNWIQTTFLKNPLPTGLKRISAPKVRTLDGMEAMVYTGNEAQTSGIRFHVTPHVDAAGTSLTVVAESQLDGKSVWKLEHSGVLDSKEGLVLATSGRLWANEETRRILIVRVSRVAPG